MSNPVNPKHYKQYGIEAIDILCEQMTKENITGYYKGNIFKYVFRVGKKGRPVQWLEDLCKAQWYIERLQQEIEKEMGLFREEFPEN